MGGERLYIAGCGNAEGNHTEDDFNEWKKNLWRELFAKYESENKGGRERIDSHIS
jgi:hypothetical protein